MRNDWFKRIGLILLLVPLGFLSLFLFGELFSGDISGLGHFVQMLPLLVLFFVSWKNSFLGGILLVLISIFLGALYAIDVAFLPVTILMVEALFFLPPFIAGILLTLSSIRKKRES